VSVAFAEYLEAIVALTGSPFRWGRWRGSWLQAGTVINAGVLGCVGLALSLPTTFARGIPYASSVTGFLAHLMALQLGEHGQTLPINVARGIRLNRDSLLARFKLWGERR